MFERHPILPWNYNIVKSLVHNNFFKREASWWLLMKSFATCANFEIKGRSLKMAFRSTPKILAWNEVHYLVHQTNSDANKSSRIFFFTRKFFVPSKTASQWWTECLMAFGRFEASTRRMLCPKLKDRLLEFSFHFYRKFLSNGKVFDNKNSLMM